VAVAPKLAILLHDLWVTGEVYEALRNSQGAARRPSCRLTEFWFCANRRVRVTARSRWNERNWNGDVQFGTEMAAPAGTSANRRWWRRRKDASARLPLVANSPVGSRRKVKTSLRSKDTEAFCRLPWSAIKIFGQKAN
jgi:hypothetical protein